MDDNLRLGYYAYYPTILEPAPGPWGGREIFDLHPVDAWNRILVWLKSKGVDYVVAVISPKFRDNIFHDWPFCYICDLDRYPEARTFPPELVDRHRRITNAVVDLAGNLGLDLYFTHSNFCAPRAFVTAHETLRQKYLATRGHTCIGHDSANILNTLLGNVCWWEPVYQDFLKSCWAEFFHAVPRAKGLMITPGEFNACLCPLCRGPSLDPADIAAAQKAMKLDFVHAFVAEMDRWHRHSLVRTWYLDVEPPELPAATAFVAKYQALDCFDAPIDPQTEREIASGRPVHLMFDQNGENAAQILWFRDSYWRRIGHALSQSGAHGALLMHNIDWGMNGMTHPAAGLNLEAFFHYARRPQTPGTHKWRQRTGQIFGPPAAEILDSLDRLAELPMNVTRIIFLGKEGYTFGPIQPCDGTFAPDPWGVLGRDWSPPDWARGDVGRLREYWDDLARRSFVSFEYLAENTLKKGQQCPLQVMGRVVAKADEAVTILEGLTDRVRPESRGWLDGLITSAHITREHAAMLLNSIKTALLIRAARSPLNSPQILPLAKAAIEAHALALEALKRQIVWTNALPHDFLDFRNWLRLKMPAFNSYQAVAFTPLELMEQEDRNLRQWLQQLDPAIDPDSLPHPALPSLTAEASIGVP